MPLSQSFSPSFVQDSGECTVIDPKLDFKWCSRERAEKSGSYKKDGVKNRDCSHQYSGVVHARVVQTAS